jgi:hypothetical protein
VALELDIERTVRAGTVRNKSRIVKAAKRWR